MEVWFKNKVRYVFVLRQKQSQRGTNNLHSQKIVKISQVFPCKMLRKSGDKRKKKRYGTANQNNIINVQ